MVEDGSKIVSEEEDGRGGGEQREAQGKKGSSGDG